MSPTTISLPAELKSRIDFAGGVADDIERIAEPLIHHDISGTAGRIQDILRAIDVREYNPMYRPSGGARQAGACYRSSPQR